MPSAPKIRKELLHIVESSILPMLHGEEVVHVLADSPFDLSQAHPQTIRQELLPDNDHGPLQVLRNWWEEGMVATRGISFSFCYAGAMHQKIGVTQSMGEEMARQGLPRPAGITMIEITAPAIVVSGSFVAHESTSLQPILDQDTASTLSLILERDEIYVFHSSHSPQGSTGSHLLSIQDSISSRLWQLYYEALRRQADSSSTRAILQAAFLQLEYQLKHTQPRLSNSCWVDLSEYMRAIPNDASPKHQALCLEVIDYIYTHLHLPLSIEKLAQRFNVSAFHLNRVFRELYDITVMNFVIDLRLRTAKIILTNPLDPIQVKEIAQLVGFSSVTNFCTVFRNHTGLTPSQYRKIHRLAP
jgi:AraC-like DNA-binding protein